MNQMLKLYHFGESSASYRVRAALELKQISYVSEVVNIRKKEHRTNDYSLVNAQQMVPYLVTDSGASIGQSVAILEWLEEKFPETPLYPDNYEDRAIARSWMQQVVSDTGPYQKTTAQLYLRERFGFDDDAVKCWLTHWMARSLTPLEQFCKERLETYPFSMGKNPGIVECCVIPQLYNARKFGVDLGPFPALRVLEKRCLETPPFKRAHPREWAGKASSGLIE